MKRAIPKVTALSGILIITGCANYTLMNTRVIPASIHPTVSITARAATVALGESDALTVDATNATSLIVTGSDGSSHSLDVSGGTITVTPSSTTTYTAEASNANVTATARTTIQVEQPPAPSVSIIASKSAIIAGASDGLTVKAANATNLTVTGSDGTSYALPESGATLTVTPASTTTYIAEASNSTTTVRAQTTVEVDPPLQPTVSIVARNSTITLGSSDSLTVTATNATKLIVTGSDGSSYQLSDTGGILTVTPARTTTYTVEASDFSAAASAATTVNVIPASGSASPAVIEHVVMMLQENHTFDNYLGMLNPYRRSRGWDVGADGKTYQVDGIDDKLDKVSNQNMEGQTYSLFKMRTTCIDEMNPGWSGAYRDVNIHDYSSSRKISMDGFVYTAESVKAACEPSGQCPGKLGDPAGQRAMGYYDETFLNWYYYMAAQFAVSDRWFSPISSKSIPNRLATFTGGTTQGLVYDPGGEHLPQLNIKNIFEELQDAGVSWKIYYTTVHGGCLAGSPCGLGTRNLPNTTFLTLAYSTKFIYMNPNQKACKGTTKPSSVWGDKSNSFCVDPDHIAPLSQYFIDAANDVLPAFAFIESGSDLDDEHPGPGNSVLSGQSAVASIVNALMASSSWSSSAFFLAYDEGGGPYDHVPPVAGHSNDFSQTASATYPDISSIAVNPDDYKPCVPVGGKPTIHCDLPWYNQPGGHSTDAAAQYGFRAQLGFRIPNLVISPFTRQHYVSHVPMDHTAVIKFVENRFVGSSAHLTARDVVQPNLLDFFDFSEKPWSTPPSPPAPVTAASLGYDPCDTSRMGP